MAFAEGVAAAQSARAWGRASSSSDIPSSSSGIAAAWVPSAEVERLCTSFVRRVVLVVQASRTRH